MKLMEEKKGPLKIKKTKILCHFCNKKVKLCEQIKCNCGYHFCPKHMNRHSHNCTFDMKRQKKEELEKNNPKMGKKVFNN
jgi:predicted nucleic acid binding AN1-type Zn finger protein